MSEDRFRLYSRFRLTVASTPDQVVGEELILVNDDNTCHPSCYFPRLDRVYPVQLYADDISGTQATSVVV